MRVGLVTLVFVLLTCNLAFAQLYDDDGNPLQPRGFAPGEENQPLVTPRYLTPPPAEPVRATAEWEEVEAIMVRWPNSTNPNWNLLWAQFLQPVALDLKIYVICASQAQITTVQNYFLAHNVPIDSMEFQVQATNTVWIRDYGPWWVWRQTSWDRAIVDWIYNRPRPQDNVIPEWQAALWGLEYYGPNLVFTGGNFMVDGWGRGFCSELVLQENGTTVDTKAELDSVLGAFMDLDTVYTFPRFFGIDHIDMSMKLLNDHTCILNRYPAGNQYNAVMDSCEEILSQVQNPWGQNVQVVRINTPSWDAGTAYTYTNAIFVNNKVLLPIYNRAEDAAAIALWDSLLPGYSIYSFDCNSIIPSQGAIHCVVKEVIHRYLIRIEYSPLPEQLASETDAQIRARVTSLGTLNSDSLQLFYTLDTGGAWQTQTFASLGNDSFSVMIPPQRSHAPVYYYVRAKNVENNWTTMPRYGPEAHFVTQFPNYAPAAVNDLTVARAGNDIVLDWSPVTQDVHGFFINGVQYEVYGATTSENIIAPANLLDTVSQPAYTLVDGVNSFNLHFIQVVAVRP
jgi:agmatine/peptidylarginine deiminase